MADDTIVSSPTADPASPPELPKPGPWGFWATLGLGVLAVAGAFAAGLVLFGICMFSAYYLRDRPIRISDDPEVPWFEVIAVLFMGVVGTALLFLFARLRKSDSVAEYFGIRWVPFREAWLWLLMGTVVGTAYLTVSAIYGLEVNFEVDDAILPLPSRLSWLAEVVAVPVFTVFLFQGFLLPGFCASALGRVGGAVFMMALWIALWYWDGVDVAVYMAVFGALLTWARLQTGSTVVPCAMYVIERILAMTAVVAFRLPVD